MLARILVTVKEQQVEIIKQAMNNAALSQNIEVNGSEWGRRLILGGDYVPVHENFFAQCGNLLRMDGVTKIIIIKG